MATVDGGGPPTTPAQVLAAYERVRDQLPRAVGERPLRPLPDLAPLTDAYDLFLFDAFGVLNLGERAIPDASARLQALRAAGKTVLMVSNAASVPLPRLVAKYQRLGMGFTAETLVSSREALLAHWRAHAGARMGVMAPDDGPLDDLPTPHHRLLDDPAAYDAAEGFVLLGSDHWTPHRQALLCDSLRRHPRPVWVGNPDLVAPREDAFSLEPGWWAADLQRATGAVSLAFGKPHAAIFQLALAKAGYRGDPRRVLMVGDTLHTDVLGAQAMGFDAAWVVGQGASAGLDVMATVRRTGIWPDYVLPHI